MPMQQICWLRTCIDDCDTIIARIPEGELKTYWTTQKEKYVATLNILLGNQ